MKESIEKKLGMTIEEFAEKLKKVYKLHKSKGMETEMKNPLSGLTYEEKNFLVEYVEENGLEVYA
ncbi:MAG: hypothetical protein J5929_09475 [Eubacterium sp.]|nr:hypothetical protein [Eubacterium sp.]